MTDDSDCSDTLFTRRRYLGVLGATSAAVAVGATEVEATTEHGYGMSGYGARPYGDGDESATKPIEGTPQIEVLTGDDVSNPNNPHVDAKLNWEASIDASELYAAELVLSDHEGRIDSWSYNLSGDTASATERTRIPNRAGEQDVDYTAELVVYSYYGNTDTETTTFTAQ